MLPTLHHYNKYSAALVNSIKQEEVDLQFIAEAGRFFPLFKIFQVTNNKPQIIHLHWIDLYTIKKTWWRSFLASIIYIFGLIFVKILGIKIVWTVHDYTNVEERHIEFDLLIRRVTAKLTDAIIVHSIQAKHEIAKLYKLSETHKQKIKVIPHGHYIDQYPNNISQSEAIKQLGLQEDIFLFGFVGYIRPYKGVLNLIEAFKQIDGERSCLLIAGKPFDLSFGKTIAEAVLGDYRIHLNLDFIADEDLQVFLNAVDVVVLPFTRSLTSGSLILAMSFGKAVIVSDGPSISEVLPAEGGIIYKNGELAKLIQALQKIQTMDVVSMGQKNLERARTFDWASIARATIQVYRKTLY